MDSPCIGCVPPERHLGCHDHCEKRKTYLEEQARRKAMIEKGKEEERAVQDYYKAARKRLRWKSTRR